MAILKGRDTIAQAHSGSGKTATFLIAILQMLDTSVNFCQSVIVCPTRELALQIEAVLQALSQYMSVKFHCFIGGTKVSDDINILNNGIHVAVGTPGRISQMLSKGSLRAENIKIFCMDEADELLSLGFKEQVHDIIQYLPTESQIILFSATMPREVFDIFQKIMKEPARILVKKEELTLQGIKQFYIDVEKEEFKFSTLTDLYETVTVAQAIIYCNSRRKVDWLSGQLKDKGFTVSSIHGDLDMPTRERIMKEFRSGTSRVLVSTDLLARGIDVQQVSLVICYDLSSNRENYIHRIGRSGRFGRKGVAINFIIEEDKKYLHDIEEFYHTRIEEMPANIDEFLKGK